MSHVPKFQPTDEQQAILNHRIGQHARVQAGPGTGKSATLVALIDSLLNDDSPPRVRLLTFTRAATGELAEKLLAHPAAAAEKPSTIHSFAISVLTRNAGVGGFPEPLRIADRWEEQEVVHPTLARRAGVGLRRVQLLIKEMAAGWERLQPWEDPRIDPQERARFLGAWQEHRQIYGYTLLDELPYACRQALNDHPDINGIGFDLMLVDEYQDLNSCDLDLIRLVADRGCAIIGAGDDDQSIYGFRYAAPEGIRRFLRDYPHAADYRLSITQRCGRQIIEWANHVIAGDPERPPKQPLTPKPDAPPGEVGLLAWNTQQQEATGVRRLVQGLVDQEGLEPSEILILFRSDHNGTFSDPIKQELNQTGIPISDPGIVEQMLAEKQNRRFIEILRLLADQEDSIAWASLLHLERGVGEAVRSYVYNRALESGAQFGRALLDACAADFPNAPSSSERVRDLIDRVNGWLAEQEIQGETPDEGWGHWILATVGGNVVPEPTPQFADLLRELDDVAEEGQSLGRFLGQITPHGRDLRSAKSEGVRMMTMGGSKGLTTRATIIAGAETGLVPRGRGTLAEERRLLYVGMTRAKEYLYATWSRRRIGPTARAGDPNVGERRNFSNFLRGGPVRSQDGNRYVADKWRL